MAYFNEVDLANSELKRFVQNITDFTLNYEITIDYRKYSDFDSSCFIWYI